MKTIKKNTSCVVILLFICFTGFTQYNVEWTKLLEGYRINSILETSDSGYIITASNYSDILNDYQAWLIKMNLSGDTVWSSYLGNGKAQVACQTLDNGYMVGTSSYGLVKTNSIGDTLWAKDSITIGWNTFKPSFGDYILPTYDSGFVTHIIDNSNPIFQIDYYVKLDKSGNPGQIFPGYVIPASDSGYIIKREYSDSAEFIKMNFQFDTLWRFKYPCGINYFFEDLDGGVIATGYLTFGGNDDDILLLKLDEYGSIAWTKLFDEGGYEESYSVRPTINSGYIVCGYTEPDDGSFEYYALVYKTDTDGDTIWTKIDTLNKHSWSVYCHQAFDSSIVYAAKTDSYEIYFEKITFRDYEIEHVDTTICEGETYFAENEFQTEPGIYLDTITDILGYDSLIIITVLHVSPCDGHIPNGNLESWTLYNVQGSLFYDLDSGWYTLNQQLAPYCVVTVEPELISDSCGDFAVKIENIYTPADTFPGVMLRFQEYGGLFPVYERHSSINYSVAYFPENGDSAYIGALMYKNDTIIGMSEYLIGDTIAEWTHVSQDIIYFDSTTVPDSMGLGFFAYRYKEGQPYNPLGESELYIDNISLDEFIEDCHSGYKHAFALKIDSISNLTSPDSYVLVNMSKDLITEIEYVALVNDTAKQVGGRQLCLRIPYQKNEVYMPVHLNAGDTMQGTIDNTFAIVSDKKNVVVPLGTYDAYIVDFFNVKDSTYEETWVMSEDVGRIAGKMTYAGGVISYVVDSMIIAGGSGIFPLAVGNEYYYQVGDYTILDFTQINVDTSICMGDSIYLQNSYQTIAGIYYDTIYNIAGDSVKITDLTVYSLPQVFLGEDTTIQVPDTLILSAGTGFASYYWNTADTTQTITIYSANESSANRDYFVIVTDFNSCINSDTITIFFNQNVDISHSEGIGKLSVYPNPFNNTIQLWINTDSVNEFIVQLLSIDGKLIYHNSVKNSCTISTEKLTPGMYLLKIKNSNSEEIIKMLKMKN